MVLDHPEPSESVGQPVQVIEIQDDEPLLQQPQVEEPMLALVPYQPLALPPQNLFVGMIQIVAGTPLPPEMVWKRAFENLMPEICSANIPKPMLMPQIFPIFCAKRSWCMAFDEDIMNP